VIGFFVILTPGIGISGFPDSNFARYSGVNWLGSNAF
jgi:hypothetical protein